MSCVSDVSEYIALETDRESFNIVAHTRESGKLTIKLYKSADSFIDGTIICSLNTNTVEYYTCSSGTLSGTSCYSCPNDGTLSGTTCVF